MHDSNNSNTNKSTDSKNEKIPLSRFWACFFSCSIFALFWIMKMEKTRKWIPMFIFFILIHFVIGETLLYPILNDEYVLQQYYDMEILETFMDYGIIHIDDVSDNAYPKDLVDFLSLTAIVFYYLIVPIGSFVLVVAFMFKWTTQYNLKHFGYKSKKEWKKSLNNDYNITQSVKKELKIIGNEITDGVVNVVSKLKPKTKTGEDEIIEKINKYHSLMEQGKITKSDFENKKSDLLDKSSKMN